MFGFTAVNYVASNYVIHPRTGCNQVGLGSFYLTYCWNIYEVDIRPYVVRFYRPGVDFTKGFKTWHKFSTEIRFMLIPIIVLFIAHEFITGNFDITGKHRAMTEHSTKIYLWPSSVLYTFVKHTPDADLTLIFLIIVWFILLNCS